MGEGGGHGDHHGTSMHIGVSIDCEIELPQLRSSYDSPYDALGSSLTHPVLPAWPTRRRRRLDVLRDGWQDALFWVGIVFLCIALLTGLVLGYIWLCHEIGSWAALIAATLTMLTILAGAARSLPKVLARPTRSNTRADRRI
jgi:hypothetical protein